MSSYENVLVLGASDNPDRYSYKVMKMLEDNGHRVLLVNPNKSEIEGRKVFRQIEDVEEKIDTVTVYVNAEISNTLLNQLISLKPKRVIFNPGSENEELEIALKEASIFVERACTLVLISTQQF